MSATKILGNLVQVEVLLALQLAELIKYTPCGAYLMTDKTRRAYSGRKVFARHESNLLRVLIKVRTRLSRMWRACDLIELNASGETGRLTATES